MFSVLLDPCMDPYWRATSDKIRQDIALNYIFFGLFVVGALIAIGFGVLFLVAMCRNYMQREEK